MDRHIPYSSLAWLWLCTQSNVKIGWLMFGSDAGGSPIAITFHGRAGWLKPMTGLDLESKMLLQNNFWKQFFSRFFFFSKFLLFCSSVLFCFLDLGLAVRPSVQILGKTEYNKLDESLELSRLSVSFFIQTPFGTDFCWNQKWFSVNIWIFMDLKKNHTYKMKIT